MIDCHYHLDETMVSLPGLLASMDAAGIERMALIPAMCPPLTLPRIAKIGLPLFRKAIHSPSGLLQRGALSIYKHGVKGDGTVDLMGMEYEIKVQPRNDEVMEALRRHPDRLVGWVFINPVGPVDPLAEIARCFATPGMIGVKAHPHWHNYAVTHLKETASDCAAKGRPLLIHLGAGTRGDFKLLPETFPGLKVVYAHAGIPYSPAVCDYAREKNNVYVDLSSMEYVDLDAARQALRRAGADKCLFGTDGPYFHAAGDRFDFSVAQKMLRRLRLVETDFERVSRRNFAEVAGLI